MVHTKSQMLYVICLNVMIFCLYVIPKAVTNRWAVIISIK